MEDRQREIAVDSEGTWGDADVTYFNHLKRSGNCTYRCNTCINSRVFLMERPMFSVRRGLPYIVRNVRLQRRQYLHEA